MKSTDKVMSLITEDTIKLKTTKTNKEQNPAQNTNQSVKYF